MRARRLWKLAAVTGVIVSAGMLAGTASVASASVNQVSIIQDANRILTDPVRTLATFRALGARMVRLSFIWAQIAPSPDARNPPA